MPHLPLAAAEALLGVLPVTKSSTSWSNMAKKKLGCRALDTAWLSSALLSFTALGAPLLADLRMYSPLQAPKSSGTCLAKPVSSDPDRGSQGGSQRKQEVAEGSKPMYFCKRCAAG